MGARISRPPLVPASRPEGIPEGRRDCGPPPVDTQASILHAYSCALCPPRLAGSRTTNTRPSTTPRWTEITGSTSARARCASKMLTSPLHAADRHAPRSDEAGADALAEHGRAGSATKGLSRPRTTRCWARIPLPMCRAALALSLCGPPGCPQALGVANITPLPRLRPSVSNCLCHRSRLVGRGSHRLPDFPQSPPTPPPPRRVAYLRASIQARVAHDTLLFAAAPAPVIPPGQDHLSHARAGETPRAERVVACYRRYTPRTSSLTTGPKMLWDQGRFGGSRCGELGRLSERSTVSHLNLRFRLSRLPALPPACQDTRTSCWPNCAPREKAASASCMSFKHRPPLPPAAFPRNPLFFALPCRGGASRTNCTIDA